MKEKLQSLLGGFGMVLYYGLMLLIAILPLVMIDVPFWADAIILIAVNVFPPLSLPLWIWGLVKAIQGPQDAWAIIYYVAAVVVFLPTFISIIVGFFKKKD